MKTMMDVGDETHLRTIEWPWSFFLKDGMNWKNRPGAFNGSKYGHGELIQPILIHDPQEVKPSCQVNML